MPEGKFKNLSNKASSAKDMARQMASGLSFFKALTDGSKSKINNWSAFFMIVVALSIDFVQALVALIDAGYISGPMAIGTQMAVYTVWFELKGISYWGDRKAKSKVITSALEVVVGWFIPYANLFMPASTIMVIAAVTITRMEEMGATASSTEETEKNPETKTQKREADQSTTANSMRMRDQTENSEGIKNSKRIPAHTLQSTDIPSVVGSNVVESSNEKVA